MAGAIAGGIEADYFRRQAGRWSSATMSLCRRSPGSLVAAFATFFLARYARAAAACCSCFVSYIFGLPRGRGAGPTQSICAAVVVLLVLVMVRSSSAVDGHIINDASLKVKH